MLQKRKYITDTIIPQNDVNVHLGKKMFPENREEYLKLDHSNAGVHGDRIGELNVNSRKLISIAKSDSSQMKDALNYSNDKKIEIHHSKKPLVSYSCYQNQAKYFETKLVPDSQGRMSICVGRKSGSATVNMNVDDYDLEKTYHTWKKISEKSTPHTRSNLENDRFLTVAEDAQRSDRMPVVKNRNPPVANADGPFEIERQDIPRQARDNLDRTLTPKITTQKYENSKRPVSTYKNTFSISQPHAYPTVDRVLGVKRNVSEWAYSDRVKKIIHNYSDDESDDVYGCYNEPQQRDTQEPMSACGVDSNYANPTGNYSHRQSDSYQQTYTQQPNAQNREYDGNKEIYYSNQGEASQQNYASNSAQYTNTHQYADHHDKPYVDYPERQYADNPDNQCTDHPDRQYAEDYSNNHSSKTYYNKSTSMKGNYQGNENISAYHLNNNYNNTCPPNARCGYSKD